MPPQAPNISASPIQPYDGIIINISNPDNVVRNDIFRRIGTGDWEFLGSSMGQSNPFIDYSASSGTWYTYRATAVAADDSTTNSNTVQHSITFQSWWLKDLSNIDDSIDLFVDNDQLELSTSEDQAKFNPLGRKYPLVIKEHLVKAAEFPISAQFLGNEDYWKFKELYERQTTLLLQSPMEQEQWYFVFGSSVRTVILNTEDDYRVVSFDVIEVGRPSVPNQ